jgi:dihydroorotase-like cyclic amidohydrolase
MPEQQRPQSSPRDGISARRRASPLAHDCAISASRDIPSAPPIHATPSWTPSWTNPVIRAKQMNHRYVRSSRRTTSIMPIDCVIRNGKLVIPNDGIREADLAISGEKIVQIGSGIADAKTVIDAKGQYVFPGCVDTHSHYGHCNEFYDEMATESKCLASLGITTSMILLDRCIKNMEGWKERKNDPELFEQPIESVPGFIHAMWKGSYRKIFPEVVEKSEKVSANDFGFHLATVNDTQIADIPHSYHELGVSVFKAWTGLYRSVALSPPQMWRFFKTCKEVGALPYINTINFAMQEEMTREAAERAKTDKSLVGPKFVKAARGPDIIETLDLHTTLCLAKEIALPEVMIAHVATSASVELMRQYKQRGLNVLGETCGVWLTLWWPEVGEKLGHMATCIIPQISDKDDVDALWAGIRNGDITCVGTDGVISPRPTFPDGKPNPLYMPTPTKEREGMGFPSHICNFPVTLHEGLKRGFSPVQIAEICAYHPARTVRLYPKKGTIAVGSDADLVFVDIGTPQVIRKEELNTVAPFNPWEGVTVDCWPTRTMLRGEVIFENGKQVSSKRGRYQRRYSDS